MLVSNPFNALIKTTNAIAPIEYPNKEIPVIKFTTVGFAFEKKYRLDILKESLINLVIDAPQK